MPQRHPHNDHRRTTDKRNSSRPDRGADARLGTEISAAAQAISAQMSQLRAKSLKAGLLVQSELFDTFQAINREWVMRATSEAQHAFNLPHKLTTVRSLPDAISAYQDWLSEWVAICGEDSRRLLTDGQKIVDTGVRCLAAVSPSGQ